MRMTLAVVTCVMAVALSLPASAQGFEGCPPGLAKKGNGCLPPGQARKVAPGYVSPPVVVYQPSVAYAPVYPEPYRPSGATIGITVPLP